MLRKVARRCGRTKRVSPHTLRHWGATHLLEAGTERTIQHLRPPLAPQHGALHLRVAHGAEPRAESPRSPRRPLADCRARGVAHVPPAVRGSCRPPTPRPALDVADIVRTHGAAYRREHALSLYQRAVLRAIATCRTPLLGGHLDVCAPAATPGPPTSPAANATAPSARPCSPPAGSTREWRAFSRPRTSTLPAALRGLVLHNRRRLFALLFAAASQTLLALGRDPRRLGATLGITAVLHSCHPLP